MVDSSESIWNLPLQQLKTLYLHYHNAYGHHTLPVPSFVFPNNHLMLSFVTFVTSISDLFVGCSEISISAIVKDRIIKIIRFCLPGGVIEKLSGLWFARGNQYPG